MTRVPPGVDAADAATLILSWMTAYQLLHRAARVRQGQRALVQGAAGAVGQALLVLGRLAGLELWGTARAKHAGSCVSLAPRRSTTSARISRTSCRAVSMSSSTASARTAIVAPSRRSSRAACSRHRLSAAVQAEHRMFSILGSLARLYLWGRLPAGSAPAAYSINVMRARHPGLVPRGPGDPLRASCEPRHPAARPRPDRLRPGRRGTPTSRLEGWRASSSCARDWHRGPTHGFLAGSTPCPRQARMIQGFGWPLALHPRQDATAAAEPHCGDEGAASRPA